MARAVVSRVKILAGLNIAERRLPQDGRARVRVGETEADLRVATMPALHGEAVVIRILVKEARALDLSASGWRRRT
jgi:general secretion pathway protein E